MINWGQRGGSRTESWVVSQEMVQQSFSRDGAAGFNLEPRLNQMLHGVILRHFENEKRSESLAYYYKEFRSDSGVSTDLSCKEQRNLLSVQKSRPGTTGNFWILFCLLEYGHLTLFKVYNLARHWKKSASFSYNVKFLHRENQFLVWLLIHKL